MLQELHQQIEASYPRPIRLEKTKKKREESLHEFLVKFFTDWNFEKETVYVDDHECQTDTGRRRSLGDIFMICKYYYPNVTLEEVIRELYIALPTTFSNGFRTSYCFTIDKRVWYYDEDEDNGVYNKTKHDEWDNPYRVYLRALDPNSSDEDDDEVCNDCGMVYDECECEDDDDD